MKNYYDYDYDYNSYGKYYGKDDSYTGGDKYYDKPYKPTLSIKKLLGIHFKYVDYKLNRLSDDKYATIVSAYLTNFSKSFNIPVSTLLNYYKITNNI